MGLGVRAIQGSRATRQQSRAGASIGSHDLGNEEALFQRRAASRADTEARESIKFKGPVSTLSVCSWVVPV